MSLRTTHITIALVALLVLGVGIGGAILVSGKKGVEGQQVAGGMLRAVPTTTRLALASTPTAPSVESMSAAVAASVPSATAVLVVPANTSIIQSANTQVVALAIPTQLVPAVPEVVAILPTATAIAPPTSLPMPTPIKVAEPPKPTAAPLVKLAVPTDVPIPLVREEQVGGPVAVPNDHDGPRWVTLQIGHFRNENFPEELQHLRGNTGTSAAGVSEVSLNEAMARKTAALLIERGYKVDILDATVPVGYVTDLFLSIHADGNVSTALRGFKATAPWNSVPASEEFVRILYEEYGQATGLPSDPVTSVGMADYYAFNPVTYRHAVQPNVPGTLLEMGFVTNPIDRRVMTQEQDRVALGIANSIDRYFRSGAAGNTPTPYPIFTPTVTPTYTPTSTSTSTSTPTSTSTSTSVPTDTATAVPTEFADGATATAALITPPPFTATALTTATRIPPRPTNTPVPTPTPLRGIITSDGRWLPPLSPHVRGLPQPGSSAPPVRLDSEDDEHLMSSSGRDQIQTWDQFYIPELGRSVWRKGPLRPVRH